MKSRSKTIPQMNDDLFPVRLRVLVPEAGYGRLIDKITDFLDREVGNGQWAWHNAGSLLCRDRSAFLFRHPAAALALLEAFPQLEMADGLEDRRLAPAVRPH